MELVIVSLDVDANVLSHFHAFFEAFGCDVSVELVLPEFVFYSLLKNLLLLNELRFQGALAHIQCLSCEDFKVCELLVVFLLALYQLADNHLELMRTLAGWTDSRLDHFSDFNNFFLFLHSIQANLPKGAHFLHDFELVFNLGLVSLSLLLSFYDLCLQLS